MINPLIQREFFGILRRRRAVAMLVTLATIFSLLVLFRWPSDAVIDLTGARSRQVFRVFGYGLLAGVLLLVPAYPAASIVSEKNRGTLALLLNSPMRPWSIYCGKLAGSLLFALLLFSTSLPAAAACYAMGGIDPVGGFGLLYAILLLLTIEYTTLALLVSTYVQGTDGGVRVTYSLVFALSFLSLGPQYIYQGQNGWLPLLAEWLRQLSPIPPIMRILGHGGVGSHGLITADEGVREFFAMGAVLTVIFIVVAISRLNYRLFDRSRAQGVITQERSLLGRMVRRFVFVVDPQSRKSGIPFYLNPVMVKEFRSRRFGRSHWLIRLVAVCAVVSLLLTFAATLGTMDWGVETMGGLIVLLQVVLVVLLAPSLAAGLISSERESGGWDLLRMTPLSAFAILRGKLLSVGWTLIIVLLATLPGYLVMIYIRPAMWLQVYFVLICLLLTALLTLAISAAISSLFVRTATSTTTAYVVLIVLFLGPLLVWLGREQPFGHRTVQVALMVNPMGAAMAVMETPGFAQYELLPASWWISGAASGVLLLLLCFQTWRLTRAL